MGLVEAAESGLDLRRLLLASGEGKEVGRLQKCIFYFDITILLITFHFSLYSFWVIVMGVQRPGSTILNL